MKPTNDYLKQAQSLLVKLFKSERSKLLNAFGNVEHQMKEDNTVVTEMDKAMERSMRATLKKFDPSVGIEGEELGVEGNRKTYWLLDPIDGTEGFIRGLPIPRNMATLIDDGEPVFCVVYKFVTDELFIATKGQGTTLNGENVQVSDRPLARAWIDLGTDLSDAAKARKYISVRKHIAGYIGMRDFLPITTGGYEGFMWDKPEGGPWDYAPRALLIKEAGGIVTNIGSDKFDLNVKTIIATNSRIYDQLHKLYLKY